ncbi:alcohol dehydrogenase catalytic domain-containing protein [Nocardiopsis sp. ARC36]
MRAVSFSDYGDPSVLTVVESEVPEPGPGQVRVAVRAAGVNPFDVKARSGLMAQGRPLPAPRVPGLEAAGVVDAVGEGVTGTAVGDAVAGWTAGGGGYAEYAVLSTFAAKPEALTWQAAAALPVAGRPRSARCASWTPGAGRRCWSTAPRAVSEGSQSSSWSRSGSR